MRDMKDVHWMFNCRANVHQSVDKSSIVPLGYAMKATQTLRVCRTKLALQIINHINLSMFAALVR